MRSGLIAVLFFGALALSACSQPAPLKGVIFMCPGPTNQSALPPPPPVYNETGFYWEQHLDPEEAYFRNLPPPRGGYYP